MSDEVSADATATETESTVETVDQTEETTEVIAESEEKSSEEKAEDEETKRQASERTKRRREQRAKAAARREREARIEAEKRAEYYRGLAEARASSEPQENAKPQADDFESYDEYLDAVVDWKLAQAGTKEEEQAPAAKPESKPDAQPEPEEFKSFREAGTKKYGEDFEEMMEAARNQEFAASELMVNAMLTEEVGPDLAMHFYDNPDEALRVSQLPPLKQAMELNKVAESLKTQPEKKISQAPDPIKPEKGSSVRDVDLSKVDTEEYIARRRKQLYGA